MVIERLTTSTTAGPIGFDRTRCDGPNELAKRLTLDLIGQAGRRISVPWPVDIVGSAFLLLCAVMTYVFVNVLVSTVATMLVWLVILQVAEADGPEDGHTHRTVSLTPPTAEERWLGCPAADRLSNGRCDTHQAAGAIDSYHSVSQMAAGLTARLGLTLP